MQAAGGSVFHCSCGRTVLSGIYRTGKAAKILDYVCLILTIKGKSPCSNWTSHSVIRFTGDIFRNSCDQALRLFEKYGFPKEKLLMGAAFYSRQWEEVRDRYHGFLQMTPKGAGDGPNYDELAAEYINKNGYVRYWDDEAKHRFCLMGILLSVMMTRNL